MFAAAPDEGAGLFPPTRWTLVVLAQNHPEQRREALGALLGPRWNALYALARRRGLAAAQAEDAVQGFIERLVKGDVIERLDPERGKLRAYLKTAFSRHLVNLRASSGAAKRGAGRPALDLDALEEFVANAEATPEVLFDRAYALGLFESALADLEQEFARGKRQGPFAVLKELFHFGETASYAELAAEHGMSVPQLKAFVHRAKSRFSQLFRARVAETVAAPDEVDAELRSVLALLSGE